MFPGASNNIAFTACSPLTLTMNAEVTTSLPSILLKHECICHKQKCKDLTANNPNSTFSPPRNIFRLVQFPLILPLQVLWCSRSSSGDHQAHSPTQERSQFIICLSYREGETPRSLTSARWSRPVIALVRVRLTTVVSPRALILGVCASRRITSCPTTASPMFLRSSPMKAGLLSLLSSNNIVTRFDCSLSVSILNQSYQTSRTFCLQEFEAAKKMGSSGPGQNSVDSLDTVHKNTSSASRV